LTTGVSAVVVDPQANIAGPSTHERWLANVKDSARVAAHLGSPVLVATAGARSTPGPSDNEQLAAVAEALRAAASVAEDERVRLALEPLNDKVDHPGTLLASSTTALELVEQMLQKLHLTNSLVGLGIVYLPLGLPVAIYMLQSALIAFSSDIEEAAMCDGANRVAVVRHMVLTLLRPTIIAIGAFTFTLCWGEYLFALSFLICFVFADQYFIENATPCPAGPF
jgi:Xylose isomerase-like TIM barrel/Binding-protein-dependent transport system inner membrane component